jgi:riboflavin kinase
MKAQTMKAQTMKAQTTEVLKHLALLGAFSGKIEISSLDLASRLKVSQQTASRYLIELEKQGFLTRELGVKKQRIGITTKGKTVLQREYLLYKRLFEHRDRLYISGTIFSGMGEGRYYTTLERYVRQFEEKLGFIPVPGTLNIEVDPLELSKLHLLRSYRGIIIKSFSTADRSFGAVTCYPARIKDIECVVIQPRRTHYSNVLELIAPVNLRKTLNLSDGDKVEVSVIVGERG